MRKYLITSILILLSCNIYPQMVLNHPVISPKTADSLDIAYYSKKRPVLASSMIFTFNMGVWAFNRYLMKEDYAYINAKTIRENFRHGFVWDNDQMGTNMFLHPYHGSLYYNSARANGYNFWQSGLFALGGSAMWELFMENEYPSINDIIATPVGGMALGEMFYRVTDLILDDRKTGVARFGREAASLLISPTRGLTRIITGDAWSKRSTSGRQSGTPGMHVMVSMGVRALELEDDIFDKGVGFATGIHIEYGDRFEAEQKKPYDYFSLGACLNIHASQPILGQLNIVGRLIGTDLIYNSRKKLNLGLYQHFDYYDSDTISSVSNRTPYKFCTPASVGIGLMYRSDISKKWEIDTFSHFNGVILGGALSDYYLVDNRNYNLASGFSSKAGLNLIYKKNVFIVSASHEMYRMFTWRGYSKDIDWNAVDPRTFDAQGDHSQAILHAVALRLDIKLKNHLYLTAGYKNYTRDTNYKYYDDVFSKTSEGKIMLSYLF